MGSEMCIRDSVSSMLDLVAKEIFLTKGIGVHEDKLTSFEYALRNAGISGTNIVLISSIFPPEAKLIPRKDGLKKIKPGQILFTIYSRNQTNEPHRLISASVGLAIPKDRKKYGYLSEYDAFGQNEKESGEYACLLYTSPSPRDLSTSRMPSSA